MSCTQKRASRERWKMPLCSYWPVTYIRYHHRQVVHVAWTCCRWWHSRLCIVIQNTSTVCWHFAKPDSRYDIDWAVFRYGVSHERERLAHIDAGCEDIRHHRGHIQWLHPWSHSRELPCLLPCMGQGKGDCDDIVKSRSHFYIKTVFPAIGFPL